MTRYTDLVIIEILKYGALLALANRMPNEAERLTITSEAEEVLDGLRDIIDNNPKSYTREDIDNATDIAHIQGQIKGDTPSPPTKL